MKDRRPDGLWVPDTSNPSEELKEQFDAVAALYDITKIRLRERILRGEARTGFSGYYKDEDIPYTFKIMVLPLLVTPNRLPQAIVTNFYYSAFNGTPYVKDNHAAQSFSLADYTDSSIRIKETSAVSIDEDPEFPLNITYMAKLATLMMEEPRAGDISFAHANLRFPNPFNDQIEQ